MHKGLNCDTENEEGPTKNYKNIQNNQTKQPKKKQLEGKNEIKNTKKKHNKKENLHYKLIPGQVNRQ